jgi:hypothetical protein
MKWDSNVYLKLYEMVGYWWFTPAILATLEAEIRRIMV